MISRNHARVDMSQDLASDWESELDPAETDTYMSPKEGSDSLHLIDLTLSREVTAFDLAIHAGVCGLREMFMKQYAT